MPMTQYPWGGRSRAWGRSPHGLADPAFGQYTWHTFYLASDVDGTSWPEHSSDVNASGTPTSTLVPTAINVSTQQYNGLPTEVVDKAFRPGATYAGSRDFPDVSAGVMHCRAILQVGTGALAGSRAYQYNTSGAGGTEYQELFFVSATELRADVEGLFGGGSVTLSNIPTGPLLIDWVVDGARMDLYVNGLQVGQTFGAALPRRNKPGSIFLGDLLTADYVGMAWRFGTAFSFTQHQADAGRLGL